MQDTMQAETEALEAEDEQAVKARVAKAQDLAQRMCDVSAGYDPLVVFEAIGFALGTMTGGMAVDNKLPEEAAHVAIHMAAELAHNVAASSWGKVEKIPVKRKGRPTRKRA